MPWKETIVVPCCPWNIRYSVFRQVGLPMPECWGKIEWQIIEFTEFLVGTLSFLPKQKLWFRRNKSSPRIFAFPPIRLPAQECWLKIECPMIEGLLKCCSIMLNLSRILYRKRLPKYTFFREKMWTLGLNCVRDAALYNFTID